MFSFNFGKIFGLNKPQPEDWDVEREEELELPTSEPTKQVSPDCRFHRVIRTTVLNREFIVEADSSTEAEVMVSNGMAHKIKHTPGIIQHGYSSQNFVQTTESAVHRSDLTSNEVEDDYEDDDFDDDDDVYANGDGGGDD